MMKRNIAIILTALILFFNSLAVFAKSVSTVYLIGTNMSQQENCKKIISSGEQIEFYFSGQISSSENTYRNIYLNNDQMTDDKVTVTVSADAKSLILSFEESAFISGANYTLEIDNLKDATGKVIYLPEIYFTAAGKDKIDVSYHLLKGNNKLLFDGRVEGTVRAGISVCNLGLLPKVYNVVLKSEKNGKPNFQNQSGNTSVLSGETVEIFADINITKDDTLRLYVLDEYGNDVIEPVEVTEENVTKSAVLIDDYWADTFRIDSQPAPSGWKIDKGTNSVKHSVYNYLRLSDTDENSRISAEKQFLAQQDGTVVFETSFSAGTAVDGIEINLKGYSNDTVKKAISVVTDTDGIYAYDGNNRCKISSFEAKKKYALRITANMNKQTYSIEMNGTTITKMASFTNFIDTMCFAEYLTPINATVNLDINYVLLHRGYIINESFVSSDTLSVSDEWTKNEYSKIHEISSGRTNDAKSAVLGDNTLYKSGFIEKNFTLSDNNFELTFRFMSAGEKELKMFLKSEDNIIFFFELFSDELMLNGKKTAKIAPNVWNDAKIVIDCRNNQYEFYLNGKKLYTGIYYFSEEICAISFNGNGGHLVDDIKVSNNTVSDIDISQIPPKDEYNVHMICYPMWREGNHFGWDRIAEYYERIPYIGTYDDGNVEASNIQLKWLAEHGVDAMVFPFVRSSVNVNGSVKYYNRYEALQEGYFNSPYSSYVNFAIMWSGLSTNNYGGSEDFRNNIVPYWIEHYFKNDKYVVINNKPVLYLYELKSMINILGSTEAIKAEIDYLDSEVKKIGFDGIYTIVSGETANSQSYANINECGIDAIYKYGDATHSTHKESQIKLLNQSYIMRDNSNTEIDFIPTAYMGFNALPWRGSNDGDCVTPSGFKEILSKIKSDVDSNKSSRNKIICLSNWNEFGEGHYLMPSNLYGFEYLDAVRDVFYPGTSHTDKMPSISQIKKCGWLYQNAGTATRAYEREKSINEYEVIKGWYFDETEPSDEWVCAIKNDNMYVEDGELKLTAGQNRYAPSIKIDLSDLEIDTSDCKYVRINMEGNFDSAAGTYALLYFSTTENENIAFRKPLYRNGNYVFELSNNSLWTGKIKDLRIWPAYHINDSELAVEPLQINIQSIEFLGIKK